jgi:hypothetical protein
MRYRAPSQQLASFVVGLIGVGGFLAGLIILFTDGAEFLLSL